MQMSGGKALWCFVGYGFRNSSTLSPKPYGLPEACPLSHFPTKHQVEE